MSDFNSALIEEFRATGGHPGGYFEGRKVLILTVTGAKTGLPREVPLVYSPHGDGYLITASYGGSDHHPAWYHNLVANPRVTLEVGNERFPADARVLEGDERGRGFDILVAGNPGFADYQTKTTRVLPVIELTRADR